MVKNIQSSANATVSSEQCFEPLFAVTNHSDLLTISKPNVFKQKQIKKSKKQPKLMIKTFSLSTPQTLPLQPSLLENENMKDEEITVSPFELPVSTEAETS